MGFKTHITTKHDKPVVEPPSNGTNALIGDKNATDETVILYSQDSNEPQKRDEMAEKISW